jgi:hypothetical protein
MKLITTYFTLYLVLLLVITVQASTKKPSKKPTRKPSRKPTKLPTTSTPTSIDNSDQVVQIPANTNWFNGAWGVQPKFFTPANIAGRKLLIVDMDSVTAAQVAAYKSQGHIVQCYISVGTMESYRDDVQQNYKTWLAATVGVSQDWPDERWLDLRKLDQVKALQYPRFARASALGCQAIEADNVDCYDNADCKGKMPGLTRAQVRTMQITYNTWQIHTAHSFGMAISLKNAIDLIPDMGDLYDFAVNESCFTYNECEAYVAGFVAKNKAVFVHEYSLTANVCAKANSMGLQTAQCASSDGNICNSNANWRFC